MMESGAVGHLAILVALVFNILAGIAYLAAARGKSSYEYLGRYSYHIFTGAVTIGVIYLFYLFFSHDFSMDYVARYSDRALPFFYLLSAFWGGQEGTYLLWLFFNALFGYIIIRRGGQYRNYAMAIFALVNMFLLTLLVKLSPFAAAPVVLADGLGLNPLLQDPWMVIHPPVIFVGYSMAAVPFAIAMTALILNDYSEWIKRTFPWMVITSLMLAAGNILGGYWAYKTLGWGGFWAWDPVENSSLIPWFVSLAVIHGLLVERRSGALRKTNLLMTAFTFWLVVYGTFLTRSGVLSDFSVHSFIDLGINNYLVGFLILYFVMTVALFIPRIKSLKSVPLDYNFWGREFILFAGTMLLFIFSLIVLFWSSLPILTALVGSDPRAADVSTYNSFALPLAVIYCLLLAASPFSKRQPFSLANWTKTALPILSGVALLGFGLFYIVLDAGFVFGCIFTAAIGGLLIYFLKPEMFRALVPGIVAFVVAIIVAWVIGVRDYMYLLYLGMAALAIVSNLIVVARLASTDWKKMGGQLAHLGFGIMLIGTLGATAYSTNEKAVLKRGESVETYGLVLSYQGMEYDLQYPHNELI
ncbi:MAG: cytochrome c biogenesis protein CcsA, partial [candidate division Zixibacteria bacterium]|nr:cytochrome c biogenesis protein CcsA [candidate division Zixibacteria bacterium]